MPLIIEVIILNNYCVISYYYWEIGKTVYYPYTKAHNSAYFKTKVVFAYNIIATSISIWTTKIIIFLNALFAINYLSVAQLSISVLTNQINILAKYNKQNQAFIRWSKMTVTSNALSFIINSKRVFSVLVYWLL